MLVLDVDSGRILWVSPGRGKAGLQGFWRRLRRHRARIGAAAMDMSGAYYAAMCRLLTQWCEQAQENGVRLCQQRKMIRCHMWANARTAV
ncbi:MAG: transposase [Verrucomicrobia bacterium]|nr:transposase [Verrucomicrobiota bacterium]